MDIIVLGIKLHTQGFLLEQEDDAAGFLGVCMTKNDTGLIKMKQSSLIDHEIETIGP